jgi:phospholipase C
MRGRRGVLAALAATALGAVFASPAAVAAPRQTDPRVIGRYTHLVVIYEENHSFDNLYGSWGPVFGRRVDGLPAAGSRRTVQVAQNGEPYACLLQNDVNLTAPSPLTTTCTDPAHAVAASAFANAPFTIDDYIPAGATSCPAPGVFAANGVLAGTGLPGGCTRDLVHRFYQEQYQLDGGRQDRYVTGSDAVGLTMGGYDTRQLPIWQYLHTHGAPHYVIADRFFQAAFGGSFLNHQFLVAARAPLDTSSGADGARHSVLDANGFPTAYPLYTPTTAGVVDGQLTRACGPGEDPTVVSCGDYAVNTIQPFDQPHSTSTVRLPLVDDTAFPTIGDRLSDAGIAWNWYSGGWDNAAGNVGGSGWTNGTTPGTCSDPQRAATAVYPYCADALFQYHHQPLNYFANYAPGGPGRAHLRDETEFVAAAKAGTLPTVSFVKPVGEENEHPGYASEPAGSTHLVDLLHTLTTGPQARDTLVVVTYDEFGGQWDHVPPPGMGTRGVHDAYGPGTRIPALVVSASLPESGVDHTVYDTTSILATIERGLHLAPLSGRDARVNDLRNAVAVGRRD